MPEHPIPEHGDTFSSVTRSMARVIRDSGSAAGAFYQGLAFRTLERSFEFIPFVIAYLWLHTLLSTKPVQIVGFVIPVSGEPAIWLFSSLLLAVFFLQGVLSYLGQKQSFSGSYRIMQGYREKLIDHMRHLPLGRLYAYRTGHLADILTDDVKRIETIFTHLAADFFSTLLAPLLLWLGLLWLDWRLALALVAGIPSAVWALNAARNYFVRAGEHKQALFGDTAGMLTEFVGGIKTLRLFNRSELWLQYLQVRFSQIKEASLSVEAWGAGPVVAYRLLSELGLVLLLLLCGLLAQTQIDSQSSLLWLLFLLLAQRLLGPLMEASEHLTVLRHAVQSEQKIHHLLKLPPLAEPIEAARPNGYDITFEQVCFAYEDETVLQDISFSAKANNLTAIVGPSGAGKSSVVNLLARFYDPQSGSVRIGGEDLKAIGTQALYDAISVVFQQVQLVDGSVLDNVRVGRPDADDEAVFAACRTANCDAFIRHLPQGYQTWIGEGGKRLSGGERQRISIARALLKDAPVLLLDEPTASVDPEAQGQILQAIDRLTKGRTVIMIAHRLSTVVHANQILVLDQGYLVERGNHQDLMQQGGLYQRLWQAQQTVLEQGA